MLDLKFRADKKLFFLSQVGVCDAVLLDPLTEDAFVSNLLLRFKRDQIYVRFFTLLAY